MDIYHDLGRKIDIAIDDRNASDIEDALSQIEELLDDAHAEDPILLYFRANCFAGLRKATRAVEADLFDWKQPELTQEILSLRRSIRSEDFTKLNRIRRCQILTNLGNALDAVGRPIDAISSWDAALRVEPKFAMAAANRAYGLLHYSSALYDPGHRCMFLTAAADSFRIALGEDTIVESDHPVVVQSQFREKLEEIENYIKAHCKIDNFDPYRFEVGDCDEAASLNRWRLDNGLFLNPLNDLATWPLAAQDIFHLPSHTMGFDERSNYAQYFDLIRQEYVAACVLLFEGLGDQKVHPADRTLLTFEHADYSVTSVQIEKQKAAFRLGYSLLDKCSVFINAYFKLGHDLNRISFRKVWYSSVKKQVLHEKLPQKNWRLRGVYAISLDLFDIELKEVSSPLAVKVDQVRNAAEHRFLSVHELWKPEGSDPYLESITDNELENLCLHVLKLARATIMGLSLAVHHQERFLKEPSGSNFVMKIPSIPKRRD